MQILLSKENLNLKDNAEAFAKNYLNKKKEIDLKNLWQEFYRNSFITDNNSFLNNILLTQGACKASPGLGLFLLTQFASIEVIKNHSNQKIKEQYLNSLVKGESIGCFALTEPNTGSDVSMLETTAIKEDKNWILNGHKIWSSNASVSNVIITFAQTKTYKDKSGITCFVVSTQMKGITILKDTLKLGVKITPSNEIYFKNLIVDQNNQIGNIGDGIKIALSAITLGRIFCAAQAVGLLEGILEESIKHSTKRNQFGKSVSEYEAIQWYIADMTKDLDCARLLLYKAVWAKENQISELNKLSSMAKYFCTSVAQKHSTKAVQILGGAGLNDNSYVASAYRDSKVLEIYEGTNEVQKVILTRELQLK